jgi:hypothetical protein
MYDIFVTHDWRNTPEQEAAMGLLDAAYGMEWRNFGTPWYDPTVDWHTAAGLAFLTDMLTVQIAPSKVVLLVSGLCADSARGSLWVGLSIDLARQRGISIVGLPPIGSDQPPERLAHLADDWVPWDSRKLAAAIEAAVSP